MDSPRKLLKFFTLGYRVMTPRNVTDAMKEHAKQIAIAFVIWKDENYLDYPGGFVPKHPSRRKFCKTYEELYKTFICDPETR